MEKEISLRISILRYLMITGIVLLHVPSYQPLAAVGGSAFSYVKAFFQSAVFRSAVPVLSCISGYLLFSSGMDRQIKTLFMKKTKAILLPFLIWNLPLVMLLYFIQSQALTEYAFSAKLYPFELVPWLNATFGLFDLPVNYPTGFLRDLYALCLVAPIFGYFLRRWPVFGLVIVALVFLNNLDGYLLLRDPMAVNFYIGGMAAVMGWNLKKLDRLAVWLMLAFICYCFAIVLFKITDKRLFYIVSPFLVWPAVSLLEGSKLGVWLGGNAKYSFFIFLSHGIILLAVSMMYSKLIGSQESFVFLFLAPLLTIAIAHGGYLLLARVLPGLLSLAVGGRNVGY